MPRHKPDEIALIMDISGECSNCHHRGQARLVAYYDRTLLVRCYNCKVAGCFTPDDVTYNDPTRFLPFIDDEDPPDEGPHKYTKGKR
jgi:hypothetical protein